jgi:hypothetical protein
LGLAALPAAVFKTCSIRQRSQQHMAVDELHPLRVKAKHIHLLRIAAQLHVVTVHVLDDEIVPEKTGFRHEKAE